jgi:hypothetical protein
MVKKTKVLGSVTGQEEQMQHAAARPEDFEFEELGERDPEMGFEDDGPKDPEGVMIDPRSGLPVGDLPVVGGNPPTASASESEPYPGFSQDVAREEAAILRHVDTERAIAERLSVELEEELHKTGGYFESRGIKALIKAVAVVMAEMRMDLDDLREDVEAGR